ncbi:FeS assembly ATPase SufC [Candidatus Protochlamydia naegleriophila]|uniref:FeS assembly ATPase SufC n=1 Tax=Candidatus Protochlamydia naegleriophila TaxID=389348 RepID=A0A0U5JD91_9BACT|nr:Fe-S cluster assembly ATPase SufC [Candidatus Protochlamydia naegleriophila]CUI15829.1 FeS assembly ATPase SufC [Candidatus Protochlamydia naegleriophila]
MLEIKELTATVDGTPILKGVNLHIKPGEIHAIMGPNGAGKSTLAKVLAGHPAYEVTAGEAWFKGQNLLEMEPEERAHLGLFMSFQYPVEIPGVSNSQFLQIAYNAKRKAEGKPELSTSEFEALLDEKMKQMEIKPELRNRNVNENFSGGEKKRNEILQMAVLSPELALLDETDSGLDIDAMRIVARGVNQLMNPEMGLLLITHYQRLLDYIKPHFVHVMLGGKIVQSGGPDLALELESKGYDWLVRSPKEGVVS